MKNDCYCIEEEETEEKRKQTINYIGLRWLLLPASLNAQVAVGLAQLTSVVWGIPLPGLRLEPSHSPPPSPPASQPHRHHGAGIYIEQLTHILGPLLLYCSLF